ncbi:hypothetical protein NUACC21_24850 [Scytonema sp. NUACC21]
MIGTIGQNFICLPSNSPKNLRKAKALNFQHKTDNISITIFESCEFFIAWHKPF